MKNYLTMLVHGDSKAGKSTLAATAPGPVLVLDAEGGGMRFVPGRKITWDPSAGAPPEGYDVYQVEVSKLEHISAAYKYLTQYEHPFRSVVFDSITEIQARLKREIDAEGFLDQQGWGRILAKLEDLVWQFRDIAKLEMNTVQLVMFIAGTSMQDGRWTPMLQGQIRGQLPYKVDISAFLFVGEDTEGNPARGLLVRDSRQHIVGERVGLPESNIWHPNIQTIFETVFGTTNQESE